MTTSIQQPVQDFDRPRPPRAHRAVSSYAALSKQVQAAGLLQRRRGFYWPRIILGFLALGGIGTGFGLLGDSWFQLLLAAALAGVLHQFAYLGHDGAHQQIFSSRRWNEWSGRVFAGLVAGLSYSWWTGKHTRHHGAPNQIGKDSDIDSKVLAFHEDAAHGRTGLLKAFTRHQGWFFFPLLTLEGLNLHVDSYRKLLDRSAPVKRRWVDLSFVTVRLVGYLALLLVFLPPGKAAAFLGVQLALFGVLMGGAFAPNHTGMPIVAATSKVDFLRRQVLMSRNITGGWWIDFALGGLNHQVEHHLFPSMPRPNLRKARPMVKAYCAEHGIDYTETSLAQSYVQIVKYLNEMGLHARETFTCPLVASYR